MIRQCSARRPHEALCPDVGHNPALFLNPACRPNHACRHADGSRSIWNVVYDYGIRSNPCMAADRDRPQDFGSRTDVYMTADFGRATLTHAKRHLLQQQAIRADFSFRMDDDAIRMRQHQTAAQFAIEGNVGAGNYAPIAVPQYRANPRHRPPEASGRPVALI